METTTPLIWPHGRPRTPRRRRAAFGKQAPHGGGEPLSLGDALARLTPELGLIDAEQCVLTVNTASDRPVGPDDPGAALYMRLAGEPHCIPCDTWDRPADNIAAIAAHLQAARAMTEHGVADLTQALAAFHRGTGHARHARSARAAGARAQQTSGRETPSWARVLGVAPDAEAAVVQAAYRALAKRHHPDNGGDAATMRRINAAWETYRGRG